MHKPVGALSESFEIQNLSTCSGGREGRVWRWRCAHIEGYRGAGYAESLIHAFRLVLRSSDGGSASDTILLTSPDLPLRSPIPASASRAVETPATAFIERSRSSWTPRIAPYSSIGTPSPSKPSSISIRSSMRIPLRRSVRRHLRLGVSRR